MQRRVRLADVGIGLVVALGVLVVVIAFKATPPPWMPR